MWIKDKGNREVLHLDNRQLLERYFEIGETSLVGTLYCMRILYLNHILTLRKKKLLYIYILVFIKIIYFLLTIEIWHKFSILRVLFHLFHLFLLLFYMNSMTFCLSSQIGKRYAIYAILINYILHTKSLFHWVVLCLMFDHYLVDEILIYEPKGHWIWQQNLIKVLKGRLVLALELEREMEWWIKGPLMRVLVNSSQFGRKSWMTKF